MYGAILATPKPVAMTPHLDGQSARVRTEYGLPLPRRDSYSSVIKKSHIRRLNSSQPAQFQHFPYSCCILRSESKLDLFFSTTYRLFVRALCHFLRPTLFVFIILWTLLAKTPRGGDSTPIKSFKGLADGFTGPRQAATSEARWPRSRRSGRQCTPARTTSAAG
jgi:hypothetical protein